MKLIGLSFSKCVADIALGIVNLVDVKKIIPRSPVIIENWDEVINPHRHYWGCLSQADTDMEEKGFIEKCIKIAYQIIPLVQQPRTTDNKKYFGSLKYFWTDSEEEVEFLLAGNMQEWRNP
jgi:hypothetical protein